jgi:thymidylate synthase (FAD)
MDCWRQWIRHRTASVNEYSTRYSEAIDSAQAAEGNWRAQAKDNKQGSAGVVTEFPKGFRMMDIENTPAIMVPTTGSGYLSFREQQLQALSRVVYEERLAFGVAREQARKDLPLSTYTEAYWKMDLHNLFHFLRLRMDPHAQSEIREFANAIAEIVKEWVPWAWEAFEDYQLGGMYLTKFEQQGISALLTDLMDLANAGGPESVMPVAEKGSGLTKGRELRAFRDKLMRLLG